MARRIDAKAALAGAALLAAALVAAACSSSDGVTPVCTDAGPNAGSCFTPPGDAAFGTDGTDDGGATPDDAADETAEDAPAE